MSFYFSKLASALRRSKTNIMKMKEDFDKYKQYLEKQNPEIYKKQEKLFGYTKEENQRSPEEKMKKNPFYWYHQLKQKATSVFTSNPEKYKLLEKANTELEKSKPEESKVFSK